MREIRFAAVGLLAAGLGFGAIAQVPAKAASWHNGTPKVLRHTWRGYGKTQWYNWKFQQPKSRPGITTRVPVTMDLLNIGRTLSTKRQMAKPTS